LFDAKIDSHFAPVIGRAAFSRRPARADRQLVRLVLALESPFLRPERHALPA
jgi:hypothetical protein